MDETAYLTRLRALWRSIWPKDVPTETRYPHGVRPLSDYLAEWAQVKPDTPAVIFYGYELTWAEYDRLSDRFAAFLASIGVARGDRVAVFLPNCPQFHIAFFGILKAGAVHVPVSPLAKAFELAHQVNDSGATVIVTLDRLADVVDQVRGETPIRAVVATALSDMLPAEPVLPEPADLRRPRIDVAGAYDLMAALAVDYPGWTKPGASLDDLAALNYTGGTTGLPKGCMHTQGDMLYTGAKTYSLSPPGGPEVRPLIFLPEFWIAGENACLIYPVFAGQTLILLNRWDPVGVMAAAERYRATTSGMPVDAALEMLEHPRFAEFDLSSLKRIRVMSFVKKLTPEHRRRWLEATGCLLSEAAWGMTETHTADTHTIGMQDDDFDLKAQPTFVGIPVRGTDIKICDFETGALKALGEEGEICCRSPSLMKGYWQKAEATAETIRDGWLHSGDIGVIDEAGYLHYLGRRKEMIKVKGMSVFPAEIETLLTQHPAVTGAGVTPRADPAKGQVPVAFVTVEGAVAAADLEAWCRERMASFKVPEVRIMEALPMTATGKVKRQALAGLLEA